MSINKKDMILNTVEKFEGKTSSNRQTHGFHTRERVKKIKQDTYGQWLW